MIDFFFCLAVYVNQQPFATLGFSPVAGEPKAFVTVLEHDYDVAFTAGDVVLVKVVRCEVP